MLSDDELRRIRDHAAANPSHAGDVVLRLVAEVERCRAREAGLVAACRSAFEAFAYDRCDFLGADAFRCSACLRIGRDIEGFPHYDDCAWVLTGEALGEWLPLAGPTEETIAP